jgi:hypothetical protein
MITRITIIVFLSTNWALAQSVDDVLKRYFYAIGGEEKITRLVSVKVELKSWYSGSEMTPGAVNFLRVPEKTHRVIAKAPIFYFCEIFDEAGKRTFVIRENDIRNCNLIYAQFYPQGYLFEYEPMNRRVPIHQGLDILELWRAGKMIHSKDSVVDNVECSILQGAYISSKIYSYNKRYCFDHTTGLLIATINADRPRDAVKFSNYTNVGGILFPFKRETSREGVIDGREQILSIEVNPTFDDRVFYCDSLQNKRPSN